MICQCGFMLACVRGSTSQAIFFICPSNHAQRAARLQSEISDDFDCLQCDTDSRSIINGASAKIPGIEMARHDHDLLGMFAATQISDDIVSNGVRQSLRCKCQAHFDRALIREPLEQVRIFSSQGSGWNFRDTLCVVCSTCMGKAKGSASCGAN